MVRAPCCEKMGLKKGPWTPEEDQILVSYIQSYGHGNWRALPKQAGLLRCGKSCRLRWTNYLRPDIKRGNFSKEEEATIISLHEILGNRWSAIAARLPGRTDNEIKNVWHTHLKKRVKSSPSPQEPDKEARRGSTATDEIESNPTTLQMDPSPACPTSPRESCSEDDSSTATESSTVTRQTNDTADADPSDKWLDESFWSEAPSLDNSVTSMDYFMEPSSHLPSSSDDDMDFWLRLLMEAGEVPELPPL